MSRSRPSTKDAESMFDRTGPTTTRHAGAMSHRAGPGTARHARTVATAGVLLAAAVVLAVAATPALSHAVLTGSQPEDGATVEQALDAVVLSFNEDVILPDVDVVGPDGDSVADGRAQALGEEVEQPLTELTAEGSYTVTWRVVSADDHPIEGELSFDYDGPLADSGEPDTEPDESRSEPPADTPDDEQPAATGDGDPTDDDQLVAEPLAEDGSGLPVTTLAVIALVVVAAAGVFAVRARREPSAGE